MSFSAAFSNFILPLISIRMTVLVSVDHSFICKTFLLHHW